MSVNFYATDVDGPIDSNVADKPHGLDILEHDGQIKITITPFGDEKREFKMLPTPQQLRKMALSMLDAANRVCALDYNELPRTVDRKQ
jgi:hypothetical protein